MEEKVEEAVVEETIESTEPEKVSQEDLTLVSNARNKLTQANLEAEKAVAIKHIAELELKNVILELFNKYKITYGVDSVMEDGTIVKPGEKE